jgi:hypothetical protein
MPRVRSTASTQVPPAYGVCRLPPRLRNQGTQGYSRVLKGLVYPADAFRLLFCHHGSGRHDSSCCSSTTNACALATIGNISHTPSPLDPPIPPPPPPRRPRPFPIPTPTLGPMREWHKHTHTHMRTNSHAQTLTHTHERAHAHAHTSHAHTSHKHARTHARPRRSTGSLRPRPVGLKAQPRVRIAHNKLRLARFAARRAARFAARRRSGRIALSHRTAAARPASPPPEPAACARPRRARASRAARRGRAPRGTGAAGGSSRRPASPRSAHGPSAAAAQRTLIEPNKGLGF